MTKIYNKLFAIWLLIVVAMLTSCEDRLEYNLGEIAEGYGLVQVEADFKNFTPALSSRADGQSIQTIDKLLVFIYDTDGKPYYANDAEGNPIVFPLEFDETKFAVKQSSPDNQSDYRVSFTMSLPNGKYRMYALANMDLNLEEALADNDNASELTEEMLLTLTTPKWDLENIQNNREMFGRFDSNIISSESSSGESATPSDDASEIQKAPMVVVNGRTSLHVWLRRCASKITLQYDGSGLYEGVSIYLMSATIKDIPISCALGVDNKVTYQGALLAQGEILDYYDSDVVPTLGDFGNPIEGIVITKNASIENKHIKAIWPSNDKDAPDYAHSPTADALFFYENMQGVHEDIDKRQQKDDKTGTLIYNDKDKIKFGTYIEVEALYYANIPAGKYPDIKQDYVSSGVIKYRFMLGKDIVHDFNAERNHHYKLTLKFKNKGNDYDWHIDYADPVLKVTHPKIFDYQGKVFVPDASVPNFDHTFIEDNKIKVTSYVTDDKGNFYDVKIDYSTDGGKTYTPQKPDWLSVGEFEKAENPYDKYLTFKIDQDHIVRNKFLVSSLFKTAEAGSKTAPCNLANPGQKVAPQNATISTTANCYMIDAPGWYLLPLVYGNGVVDGSPNTDSYNPKITGSDVLSSFKDHLGEDVESPYIRTQVQIKKGKNTGKDYKEPNMGFVVWQDADLVRYNAWDPKGSWAEKVEYIEDAYGGVGGLLFHVASINEGNALIAVTDEEVTRGASMSNANLPRTMWSWHIWATSFSAFNEEDKTIQVVGHDETQTYDFLPVNLGWCSEGKEITYYPGRQCKVRFTANKMSETIDIIQKSHIAVPRGNNTYYQWGRKDPFVGTAPMAEVEDYNPSDRNQLNKKYNTLGFYVEEISWFVNINPPRYTRDIVDPSSTTETVDGLAATRKTTKAVLSDLIQKPYIFHNPPRTGLDPGSFASNDETYFNLWDGKNNGNNNGDEAYAEPIKTIYDPCPVGFQVPHYKAFSGFTTTGADASNSKLWYDARIENINDYTNQEKKWEQNSLYHDQLYEFYTSPEKYQSIVFPQNGYRDWDSFAYIYKVGPKGIGYCWSAHIARSNHNTAFNFEFTREEDINGADRDSKYVRPRNPYFPCDAFPVRPCKQK